ncbi:MAG TPA: diguanylate cyclase [Spirochaetota bacterium]|nr:diguanylate cyclase [Spirochaetota bacterium]
MKSKILIIEDSPSFAKYLSDLFSDEYDVTISNEVEHGLVTAATLIPDLILLDIVMPGIDGYSACARLKKADTTRDIPVIFISSLGETQSQTKGLQAGAIDYIVKPINDEIVKAKVRNHIEMRQYFNQIENMSLIDPLTGIGNRRLFQERMDAEIRRMSRSGLPLALFMIDIDYFKQYNDSLGHLEGDKCLKSVATAISDSLKRGGDIVTRFGGEEFAVIAPEVPAEAGKAMAEKIRACVENLRIPHPKSSAAQVVTVSVGGTIHMPGSHFDVCDLIQKADEALYKAKSSGRNRSFMIA